MLDLIFFISAFSLLIWLYHSNHVQEVSDYHKFMTLPDKNSRVGKRLYKILVAHLDRQNAELAVNEPRQGLLESYDSYAFRSALYNAEAVKPWLCQRNKIETKAKNMNLI